MVKIKRKNETSQKIFEKKNLNLKQINGNFRNNKNLYIIF